MRAWFIDIGAGVALILFAATAYIMVGNL